MPMAGVVPVENDGFEEGDNNTRRYSRREDRGVGTNRGRDENDNHRWKNLRHFGGGGNGSSNRTRLARATPLKEQSGKLESLTVTVVLATV